MVFSNKNLKRLNYLMINIASKYLTWLNYFRINLIFIVSKLWIVVQTTYIYYAKSMAYLTLLVRTNLLTDEGKCFNLNCYQGILHLFNNRNVEFLNFSKK